MFEAVIGPKMLVNDDTVVVWMEHDLPARLVYRRSRWRVIGTPTPIIEVPDEEMHPLITHPTARRTGWRCTVQSASSSEVRTLALRRHAGAWRAEEPR